MFIDANELGEASLGKRCSPSHYPQVGQDLATGTRSQPPISDTGEHMGYGLAGSAVLRISQYCHVMFVFHSTLQPSVRVSINHS